MSFEIKDSGTRKEFAGGMVRDADDSKTDYMLALDGPMFKRWAKHLTKGAKKYVARNWMKAKGQDELEHAMKSLGHHFIQYVDGETDEDHAAAIFFNINLIEYIKDKLRAAELIERGSDPSYEPPQLRRQKRASEDPNFDRTPAVERFV